MELAENGQQARQVKMKQAVSGREGGNPEFF
ncbi:hypothetical protein CLS_08780 [[Clostridium] cf. saccharolyticum K10]|nr:hypothetical protein CLS_08780 [[Clostridium] cf. saccharolyticum K10]